MIELGCGVAGLIGVLMAPIVSTYILTDQAYVMKTLRDNIAANALEMKEQQRKRHANSDYSSSPIVVALDWENDQASGILQHLPDKKHIDLVILCDCVYNNHLIKPLVETLIDVCRFETRQEKPTYALIAHQLRSDDVTEEFLVAMMASFIVWRIPDEHLPAALRLGTGYAVHIACLKFHKTAV